MYLNNNMIWKIYLKYFFIFIFLFIYKKVIIRKSFYVKLDCYIEFVKL